MQKAVLHTAAAGRAAAGRTAAGRAAARRDTADGVDDWLSGDRCLIGRCVRAILTWSAAGSIRHNKTYCSFQRPKH